MQYCFSYRADNGDTKFPGFFESSHSDYSDAYNELVLHIYDIMGTGFEINIIKTTVRFVPKEDKK